MSKIETRGTTIFCTGNNLSWVGDLCRRNITSTMDPRVERPEFREFKADPVQAILNNRGVYVAVCLTICRAYILAGQPNKAPSLGSFEGWSDLVRSALIWLDQADPVETMEMARDQDPQLTALREVIAAWSEVLGIASTKAGADSRHTLQEVIDVANEVEDDKLRWSTLNSALQVAAGNRGELDVKRLGRWLQQHKGRIVEGLCLQNIPNKKGSSKWYVEGNVSRPGSRNSAPVQTSKQNKDDPKIKLTLTVVRETEAAVLVEADLTGREEWLPRSQVHIEMNGDGLTEFTIPVWLVKAKKLGPEYTSDPVNEIPF
jgi:hypothetical protein